MRALFIVVALSVPAAAQTPRELARKAEQAHKDAHATGDEAKYVACGNAYMEVYGKDPQQGDEYLYNAGVCFEGGGAVGAALQAYSQIGKYFPRSKISPKALARSARLYGEIGRLAEAADRLEEYAKKYAGEKDAYDALSDAVMLRTALGDNAKRIEDTKYFLRTFGTKKPAEAARVAFELTAAYEGDDKIKALAEYIRVYGGKADREQLAVAYKEMADAQWAKTCPVKPIDGLCVKLVRDKPGTRCGTVPRLVVVKRTAARKDALKMYLQAIKVAATVPPGRVGPNTALNVAATANVTLADDQLERMLEKSFPTNLDFSPQQDAIRKKSLRRFNAWLDDATKSAAAMNDRYAAVIAMKDPTAAVAAANRTGQIVAGFWRALETGEIPKDVRSGKDAKDKVDAYCKVMRDAGEPLKQRAAEAFGVCVVKAAELGLDDATARGCYLAGRELDPRAFPPREVQAEPQVVLPAITEAPLRSPDLAAAFEANEKAGWTEKTCRQAATAFAAKKTADAHYMAGLSLHRCGLVGDARKAYERAGDHARARSNLAELDWRAGKRDAAIKGWEAALAKNGKLGGAHTNLAIARFERWAALPAAERKKAAEDITLHASSALAVGINDPAPHVLLAMVASKPSLAEFHVQQTIHGHPQRPLPYLAKAVLDARGGAWTMAGHSAERAATVGPAWEPARLGAALVALRVGRYDAASTHLAAVKTASYELHVARGVAARGLGKLDDAEAAYNAAIKLDGNRAEALYNLALLYEAHRAPALKGDAQSAALAKGAELRKRALAADSTIDKRGE